MRTLIAQEIEQVSGSGEAPIHAKSSGEYFYRCMNYMSPDGMFGTALTLGSFIPGVGIVFAAGGVSAALSAVAVCSLGTIQYAQ